MGGGDVVTSTSIHPLVISCLAAWLRNTPPTSELADIEHVNMMCGCGRDVECRKRKNERLFMLAEEYNHAFRTCQ